MAERTCGYCRRTFSYVTGGRGSWQRFCSDQCRNDAANTKPTPSPCTVDGCSRPARSGRSPYCETHYYRIRRSGTLDVTHTQRNWRGYCIVVGCDQLDSGPHGYCVKHNTRVQRHGDPDVVLVADHVSGPDHPQWGGDNIGISCAHSRVTRARGGPAKQHLCVDCGKQAAQWSYDHQDPNERQSNSVKGPYSTDVSHYQARCVPCHKRFDLDYLATVKATA